MARRKLEDWQEAFLGNTTRVGFNLKLSRPMMELLCATADSVYWDRAKYPGLYEPDNWISTERALKKRGLLRRLTVKETDKMRKEKKSILHVPPYALTPAGEAVVELLRIGGLFIQAEDAVGENRQWDKRKTKR